MFFVVLSFLSLKALIMKLLGSFFVFVFFFCGGLLARIRFGVPIMTRCFCGEMSSNQKREKNKKEDFETKQESAGGRRRRKKSQNVF